MATGEPGPCAGFYICIGELRLQDMGMEGSVCVCVYVCVCVVCVCCVCGDRKSVV